MEIVAIISLALAVGAVVLLVALEINHSTIIKHVLVEAENGVLKKIKEEAEFDRIVAGLLDEWIFDDSDTYSFDLEWIVQDEDREIEDE